MTFQRQRHLPERLLILTRGGSLDTAAAAAEASAANAHRSVRCGRLFRRSVYDPVVPSTSAASAAAVDQRRTAQHPPRDRRRPLDGNLLRSSSAADDGWLLLLLLVMLLLWSARPTKRTSMTSVEP